jgi:hypothetical protein
MARGCDMCQALQMITGSIRLTLPTEHARLRELRSLAKTVGFVEGAVRQVLRCEVHMMMP